MLTSADLSKGSWTGCLVMKTFHQIYYTVFPACSSPVPCGLNPAACNVVLWGVSVRLSVCFLPCLIDFLGVGPAVKLSIRIS